MTYLIPPADNEATVKTNPPLDPTLTPGGESVTETPDVTKADIIALVQAVLALLIAFGLDLTDVQVASIIGLSAVLAGAIPIADAHRRAGRVPLVMQRELHQVQERRIRR